MRSASGRPPRLVLFWLVACLAAAWFAQLHVLQGGLNELASLERLIDFTADPPYRYRVLMPLLLRATAALADGLAIDVRLATLAALWEAVALVVLFAAFAGLVGRFVDRRPFAALAGLSLLLPLVWHFVATDRPNPFYPWDIVQILAFTLGLQMLLAGRVCCYYPVFVLATLNRETSCFLAMLFLAAFWGRLPRKALFAHVAAQAAIWLALRIAILALLGGSGGLTPVVADESGIPKGDLFWLTAWLNVDHFRRQPFDLIEIAGLYVFAWLPVALYRQKLPLRSLQRMLLVVPVFVAAMWTVGLALEPRIYGEMIPLVWLAACLLAARAIGLSLRAKERAPT